MDVPRFDARSVDADDLTRRLRDSLDEAGCAVVEHAVEPSVMDAIAEELAAHADRGSLGASDFEGHATRRTGSPLPRSATFRSIALHPLVIAAGDHILGHATTWRFSAAEYIEIGRGESAQRLHRDRWKYDMVEFGFEVEMNGMWAVTDFTEANGATRVIPGSHAYPADRRVSPDETIPAEMPKGSLLLYTGSLYHGGGPNTTDEWRRGLSLQHALGWLTQSTNQFLECPPNEVADWPDDLLRFVGYAKTGNGLGYWRDSEDPLTAVHPDREFARGWATVRPD